jgi:CRP-like cAMP-binding protein
MEKKKSVVDLESLSLLAQKFADQGMFDEAIHLYELAAKLKPESLALKMNIARLKELKERKILKDMDEARDHIQDERKKEDIDLGHYTGLAKFYFERKDTSRAIELLEICKLKNPYRPEIAVILGRFYFSMGEWEAALEELEMALRLNPFDYDISELAGRVCFEQQEYVKSLDRFMDAYLLTLHVPLKNQKIQKMIRTLATILGLDRKAMKEVYRSRLDALQMSIDRLEFKKAHLFEIKEKEKEFQEIFLKRSKEETRKENLLAIAAELRGLDVFKHFRDEEIFILAQCAKISKVARDHFVFREGNSSFDIYALKKGEVQIQKDTPFGPQLLQTVSPGDLFGELNFLDRGNRSADAFCPQDTELFILHFATLENLIDTNREVGVALQWTFWKSLADKVRNANEILKTFFTEDMKKEDKLARKEERRSSQKIKIDDAKKMGVFQEKGLSHAEMRLLATFSQEERHEGGSIVFREGEVGDKIYIIMDGQVRISKYIPGIGEEALAILGRGEFFGEMSLIDGSPRSADARAHSGNLTVLSVDRKTLHEVLNMDPVASMQFLSLLNRMLCARLREINEKIVQWKYIVGVGA